MALTEQEYSIISAEVAATPELENAGSRVIIEKLNEPGTASDDSVVVADVPKDLNKAQLLAFLSVPSLVKMYDLLNTPDGDMKALALMWESYDVFDVTHETFPNFLLMLMSANIITNEEYAAISKLRVVGKSRAEQLIGRKLVKGDL